MNSEEPRSILPVMAAAAVTFASLGLAGLFAYGMVMGIYIIPKLIVVAALLAYLAQLGFTLMEDSRLRRHPIPNVVTMLSYAAFGMSVTFVLCAVLFMAVK